MNKQGEIITPVLLGADLNAYTMAMAFAAAGNYVCHAFAKDRLGMTDNSAFIKLHIIKGLDDCNVAVPALLDFAKEHKGERLILVPCADWYMEMLEYARDTLDGHFYFNIPNFSLWRAVSVKNSFYSLLKSCGIPYPEYIDFSADECEMIKSRGSSLLPNLVLKPADSSEYWRYSFEDRRKVYFPRNIDEAYDVAKKIFASGYSGRLILQKRVSENSDKGEKAPRASVLTTYSDRHGRVKRALLGDVLLEERGPTSRGNYAAIITRELDGISKKLIGLLESIGYTGIANFDILTAENGSYCLELNPRQGRSSDYVRAAGVNLAGLLLSDMKGEELARSFIYPEVLWCAVPFSSVRRYADDRELVEKAERLFERKLMFSPFDSKRDKSLKRRIYLFLHMQRQRVKLRRQRGEES